MILSKRFMNVATFAAAMTFATPLIAATPPAAHVTIATNSALYVERVSSPTSGKRLEPASQLNRGDRVVTVVSWQRNSGDGSFTLTKALPPRLAYQASTNPREEVSVDGGKTWGRLGELQVNKRLAKAKEVTHVRWRIPATHAALGRGQIAFAGIVQ